MMTRRRRAGLWFGLVWIFMGVGLLVSVSLPLRPSAQQEDWRTFSTIFGIAPTREQAQTEADHIARVGRSNWAGPITPIPDVFRAEEGKPVTFAFFFWHNCPTALTYTYVVLLDNRQVLFELEGRRGLWDFRHRITVPPNVPLVQEFTIPSLSRGLHNLTLLGFRSVEDCFPPLPGFPPSNGVIWTHRSVLVGEEEVPEFTVALPAPESFQAGTEKKELPFTGIWIGLSPKPVDLDLPGVSLRPGQRFDYFIYARNDRNFPQVQLRQWAVVAFLEALQVPLQPFRTPMVWYESIELPRGYEITLPASLAAPRDPGVYNLVVMMLGEPYRPTTEETLWMWTEVKRYRFELRVEAP